MKRRRTRTGIYVLGSALLAAGALLLAPRIIDRLSGLLYTPPAPAPLDDESWGPEILETERPEEPEAEEIPETEEETHGEL